MEFAKVLHTVIDLKGAGHWLMEERPQETQEALLGFL